MIRLQVVAVGFDLVPQQVRAGTVSRRVAPVPDLCTSSAENLVAIAARPTLDKLVGIDLVGDNLHVSRC